jgi:hypothetical protein
MKVPVKGLDVQFSELCMEEAISEMRGEAEISEWCINTIRGITVWARLPNSPRFKE